MEGSKSIRILVVEDEVITREHLENLLMNAGYETLAVADAAAANSVRDDFRPHIVLLDLLLPDACDFNLTREFGEVSRCGVIIVSGVSDRDSRLEGLRAGADDYLNKPVDVDELLLKVERLANRLFIAEDDLARQSLRCGPWQIWLDSLRCRHDDGYEESLTQNEALLLRSLLEQRGRIFTRDELLAVLQPHDKTASTRAVDSSVSRLRSKLEKNPGRPELLLTVYGRGYRIAEVPIKDRHNGDT